MRTETDRRLIYRLWLAVATILAMCATGMAQIPATKPPNPKITLPGPQAHRPPGDRPAMTGTIFGFVYWDSTLTSHLPSPVCSALSITVAAASKSPYGPFGAMGTQSHFTPMATAHPPLTSVNTTSYDGCAYQYDNAPLNQNLYVKLNLTQPLGTLTPATVMKNPAVGPIQFSNAPCSTLPPLTKTTVASLLGKWGSCQNVAYDVNLPLVIRQSLTILSSSGGTGGNQGSQSGPLLNQTRPAGMLNNAAPQNTNSGSSPAKGMLLPAVTPAPAQTPSVSQPGIAPGGSAQNIQMNPQPLPPRVHMTNADIIKMLSGRKPLAESVIISSIRSSPHNFDLSPAGCRALLQTRITPNILAAMGSGAVRPCSSNQTKTAPAFRKINAGALKAGTRVQNPVATRVQGQIIAVLVQQQQISRSEFARMKPAGTAMHTGATPAGVPATVPRIANQVAPPSTQIGSGPLQTQSFATSQMQHVPQSRLVPCAIASTGMAIGTVAGAQQGTILSADPQFNLYTITGCNLGNPDPANQVYIYGLNGFHVPLQVQFWGPSGVAVNFDPKLAGVPDLDNVSLVLHRADGQEAQKTGLKFRAARATILLNKIPSGQISAYQDSWVAFSQSSPASDAMGYSAEISRTQNISMDRTTSDATVNGSGQSVHLNDFVPVFGKYEHLGGDDYFDIGALAAGFVADSAALGFWNPGPYTLCGAGDDIDHIAGDSSSTDTYITGALGDSHGTQPFFSASDWGLDWQGNKVHVTWPSEWCEDLEIFRNNHTTYSQYAIQVWVTGPRGLDPWTGKPSP